MRFIIDKQGGRNIMDDSIAGIKERTPPPRPYTDYNLFFQLEREYLLQSRGVLPSLKEEDVFTSSDPNYDGPELPARYEGVVLPRNWWRPGKKANKKKRQHRASHRKIGFVELSKAISSSWHSVDDETKLFCARLADMGMQTYRFELQQFSKYMETPPQSDFTMQDAIHEPKAKKDGVCKSSLLTSKAGPNKGSVPSIAHQAQATTTSSSQKGRDDITSLAIRPDLTTSTASSSAATSSASLDLYAACGMCEPTANTKPREAEPREERSKLCVDLSDGDILDMWQKSSV